MMHNYIDNSTGMDICIDTDNDADLGMRELMTSVAMFYNSLHRGLTHCLDNQA